MKKSVKKSQPTSAKPKLSPAQGLAILSAILLAGVLFFAAPGKDKSNKPEVSESAAQSESVASAPSPEQMVIDDYKTGWSAALVAAANSDPNHPPLLDFYRDIALASTQKFINERIAAGLVTRGDFEHNTKLISLTETEAVVYDCAIDKTAEYDSKTDELRVPADPTPNGRDNRLRLENGRWRTYHIITHPAACS